jgi:hypothetical protein
VHDERAALDGLPKVGLDLQARDDAGPHGGVEELATAAALGSRAIERDRRVVQHFFRATARG